MPDIAELKRLTALQLTSKDAPLAANIEKNIPIYDCAGLASSLDNAEDRAALKSELAGILLNGAGVFVLKGAYTDMEAIDEATRLFKKIIAARKGRQGRGR